jgi:hypothetical protein
MMGQSILPGYLDSRYTAQCGLGVCGLAKRAGKEGSQPNHVLMRSVSGLCYRIQRDSQDLTMDVG